MIKKILIVDDSLVARMMIENSLPPNMGYEIEKAVNGRQGFEKFLEFKPDLVFMDLTMPELDGYSATQKILEHDPNALVVALTADIQPKSVSRIKEVGAFTVIAKPAKPEIVREVLSEAETMKTARADGSCDASPVFCNQEKDILQEIMNIGFGNATADLAEIIDIYVRLSVPDIQVVEMGQVPDYMKETIVSLDETSIIVQNFWGDFSGSGLLVLPNRAASELITLLMDGHKDEALNKPIAALETESLIEIGNLLISACVGKISELLKTITTYSPPQVINEYITDPEAFIQSFSTFQSAIIMKTVFQFEQSDLSGLLMLLTQQDSIQWLNRSLNTFLESYR
ncbi:MAG: response regulator [Deltaproteobacteria bacterium]|nr:response regulator [Deltaproteobacteria bacterium]